MGKNPRWLIFLIGSIFVLIIGSLLSTMAQAQGERIQASTSGEGQSGPEFAATPVPGGPGFVSLSAMAFRNYQASDSFAFKGQTLYNPGIGFAIYEGALSLPDRATITKFVVYFYDNSPETLWAYLAEGAFNSGTGTTLATLISAGTSADYRYEETTQIYSPDVDNQSNSYWVEVVLQPSSNLRLVGVRVDYNYPANLPLISK